MVWAPFGATAWPAKLIRFGRQNAVVELFCAGLKIEVEASALTAWEDSCDWKCSSLHSEMGQQARLMPAMSIQLTGQGLAVPGQVE